MRDSFTRRLILGGMVSLFAPLPSMSLASTPVLWGDGIHDDAPAPNAWVRGEPALIGLTRGAAHTADRYHLLGGRFLMRSALYIPESARITIENCEFIAAPGFSDIAVLNFLPEIPIRAALSLSDERPVRHTRPS